MNQSSGETEIRDWSEYTNQAMPKNATLGTIVPQIKKRFSDLSEGLLQKVLEEKTRLLHQAIEDWTDSDETLPYYPFECETEEQRRRWHAWEAYQILNYEVGTIRSLIDSVPIDDRTLKCVRAAHEIADSYEEDVRGLTRHVGRVLSKSERWADKWLLRENPHYEADRGATRKQRWTNLKMAIDLIVENHSDRVSDHEKT